MLDGKEGGIAFSFHARDLHLVLGGSAGGVPIRFRVTMEQSSTRRWRSAFSSPESRPAHSLRSSVQSDFRKVFPTSKRRRRRSLITRCKPKVSHCLDAAMLRSRVWIK